MMISVLRNKAWGIEEVKIWLQFIVLDPALNNIVAQHITADSLSPE
jgi:hypothetical protein